MMSDLVNRMSDLINQMFDLVNSDLVNQVCNLVNRNRRSDIEERDTVYRRRER